MKRFTASSDQEPVGRSALRAVNGGFVAMLEQVRFFGPQTARPSG